MKVIALETLRSTAQPNVCLVVLHTDEGPLGVGESFFAAHAVETYLHEVVAPLVVGSDVLAPERVATQLRPYVGYESSGVETRGNGAVDMALWDLVGHASGQPLTAILGGPMRTSVPTYNTCAGYAYIRDEPRQEVSNWGLPATDDDRPYEDLDAFLNRPEELARSLLAMGIRAMKIWPFDFAAQEHDGTRIDTKSLDDGIALVARIREATGDDMDVLIEMHGLWTLPAATTILTELAPLNPMWVEDPIRPDNVESYQRLRERTSISLAAGETLTGRRAFKRLLDHAAIDVAVVDIGWTGGLTEARKIASLADTYGVGFAPHDCTGPVSFAASTHLVAAQPNGLVQESTRAFYTDWYHHFVTGAPEVTDGSVHVPGRPGMGITLREDLRDDPRVSRRTSRATQRSHA